MRALISGMHKLTFQKCVNIGVYSVNTLLTFARTLQILSLQVWIFNQLNRLISALVMP